MDSQEFSTQKYISEHMSTWRLLTLTSQSFSPTLNSTQAQTHRKNDKEIELFEIKTSGQVSQ